MEQRRGGTLPVAEHLRPAIGDASGDIAIACSRVQEEAGRAQYRVQFIPASDVHSLPIEGEA